MPKIKSSFIPLTHRPPVRGGKMGPLDPTTLDAKKFSAETSLSTISAPIALGPRNDFVLHLLSNHASSEIQFFIYEGYQKTWDISFDGHCLEFITNTHRVIPTVIYVRGVVIEPSHTHWQAVSELLEIVDLWDGPVIGRPSSQQFNESKLYQLTESLIPAATNTNAFYFPVCKIRKGEVTLDDFENSIVKSLSGIRSLVVSHEIFSKWPFSAEKAQFDLPVLFQEKVEGSDLRVHFLDGQNWGIYVQDKSEVDYRYSTARSEMREFALSETIKDFTQRVANIEGGSLIGFDFLVCKKGFVPLEANPGPGWAWYHSHEVCSVSFISEFLKYLKSFKRDVAPNLSEEVTHEF